MCPPPGLLASDHRDSVLPRRRRHWFVVLCRVLCVIAVVPPRRDHDFANAHIRISCCASRAARRVIVDCGVARRCVLQRLALSMFYYLPDGHHIVCIFELFVCFVSSELNKTKPYFIIDNGGLTKDTQLVCSRAHRRPACCSASEPDLSYRRDRGPPVRRSPLALVTLSITTYNKTGIETISSSVTPFCRNGPTKKVAVKKVENFMTMLTAFNQKKSTGTRCPLARTVARYVVKMHLH